MLNQRRSHSQFQSSLRLACLLEATARKPGNVHPGASFADLCYHDLVRSAEAIAPVFARSRELSVGQAILEAVRRTRESVGRNTNLGIILLLAPLAACNPDEPLAAGLPRVLAGLTQEDAALVYQAIRLAQPGGMGKAPEQDIAHEPTGTLVDVMRLAAGRDAIAAQYANGFELVLNFGVPALERLWNEANEAVAADWPAWERAVVGLHLRLMARQPDTLIARKCGLPEADESARRAHDVLDAGWPGTMVGVQKLCELDDWLRAKGNRRNPGTTADLVTACLFAALREGRIIADDQLLTGSGICHSFDIQDHP